MDKEKIFKFLTAPPEERARILAAVDAKVATDLRRAGASETRVQAAMADIRPLAIEAESQLPAQDRLKVARLRKLSHRVGSNGNNKKGR